MELTIVIGERNADVLRADEKIASLKLDHFEQMDAVILFPNATPDECERVLRLAGSHTAQYVKHRERPVMGGLMTATYGDRSMTAVDSHRLLNFDAPLAAHVAGMSVEDIQDALKQFYIPVVWAAHFTVEEALDVVVNDERLGCKVRYTAAFDFLSELAVEFRTRRRQAFRFWHSVSMPIAGGGWDLYVVPSYHPVRQPGRTEVALVNGDTDAFIRGQAVRYLRSPEPARIRDGFGSTWSYLKHPFYVTGNSFSAKLIPTYLLSEKGVEDVVQMLLGALERDGKYIAISGGFRPPEGTPTINHGGERLGSEQFCYWARQVLEEEGELEGAHIPSWMLIRR